MKLIPDEQLRSTNGINLAPMVDFLFLITTVFAVIAITRTTLYETDVSLAMSVKQGEDKKFSSIESPETAHLAINEKGEYTWLSKTKNVLLTNIDLVKEEVLKEQNKNHDSPSAQKVKILLHIDRLAPWDPVVQAIFAIRELGAEVHPVYEASQL